MQTVLSTPTVNTSVITTPKTRRNNQSRSLHGNNYMLFKTWMKRCLSPPSKRTSCRVRLKRLAFIIWETEFSSSCGKHTETDQNKLNSTSRFLLSSKENHRVGNIYVNFKNKSIHGHVSQGSSRHWSHPKRNEKMWKNAYLDERKEFIASWRSNWEQNSGGRYLKTNLLVLSACITTDVPGATQREAGGDIQIMFDFYCQTPTSGEGLGQIRSGNKHYAYNGTLTNKCYMRY